MEPLRAGIIGVGGFGNTVLRALESVDLYHIEAIADQDRELAANLARQYDAVAYDDYRSLIVEAHIDVLCLCLPTYLCGECIPLAARKGVHVIKPGPLARSLDEAIDWSRQLEKANCQFRVGAPRRFAPAYLAAHEMISQGLLGDLYLVQAETFGWFGPDLAWRGDPVLAGGGALLERGYHLVDQLVWNLGVPENVYALQTSRGAKKALPPYRTEDSVSLLLNFPGPVVANLVVSWLAGPDRERLAVYGTEQSLEILPDALRLFDDQGRLIEEKHYPAHLQQWLVAQQLRQFADSLHDREIRPTCTAAEHLANLAVVEAAYLSCRTRTPEIIRQVEAGFSLG